MNEIILENETVERQREFKKIGWTLFTMTLVVIFAQIVIVALISQLAPEFEKSPWYMGLLIGIPFYCMGFPVFLLMMKRVPNGAKGETEKVSFGQMIVVFFISMAGTYAFNIVGNVINAIIGLIKGAEVVNPLAAVVEGSSLIPTIIFMGILSPIVEEIVFRGVLLDKLRGYGDKRAIWFTALTFALFHGNLSQFFYAFVLGLIFGYIAIKTNTTKYTIVLHILVNMLGSVIMPALALSGNDVLMVITGLIVYAFIITGTFLFVKNFKKIKLEAGEYRAELRTRVIYGNAGMILYYFVCLILFISVIMA